MKRIGWPLLIVALAFLAVVSFTGFFAARTIRHAVYWHRHADETIRPWMTVGYVAHSYHVPSYVLFQALGVTHKPHERKPIRDIARDQHRSVDAVIADLQNAIVHSRPPYPVPPPSLNHGGQP